MDLHNRGVATDSSSAETKLQLFDGLERLRGDKLLSDLHPSLTSGHKDLVRTNHQPNLAIILLIVVLSDNIKKKLQLPLDRNCYML
jgi:E3 ubiquitin-protein ligase RNF1/2